MNGRLEQLKQLTSCTWDGNLISKHERDELVKAGLAQRGHGWNWITEKGIEYLVNLGLLKVEQPVNEHSGFAIDWMLRELIALNPSGEAHYRKVAHREKGQG